MRPLILGMALALVVLPVGLVFMGGGVATGAEHGPTTVITGSCKKAATVDFAVDDSTVGTASPAFVDVPGMSVTFTLGRGSTCVKVEYSASAFAAWGRAMHVQAVVSGGTCSPGDVEFSGDDDENTDLKYPRAHAFNFVCTGLVEGVHTAKIQWKSLNGDWIGLGKRSMFVHHK